MVPGERNQRNGERLHHQLLVAYRDVRGFVTDWVVNISKGGLFINTRNPKPVGSAIRLIISLPDAASDFELNGRVVRVSEFDNANNEAPGMAIEFEDIEDDLKARIERFVTKLRRELQTSEVGKPRRKTRG